MDGKDECLEIHGVDETLTFLLLFGIALQEYVTARVALQDGFVYPGCLLAQQALETFIKAILRLQPKKQWGHDLVELLERGGDSVPYFRKVLEDAAKKHFLEQLTRAYERMRYGEARFSVKGDGCVQLLDELVFNLKKTYLETMKAPETKIYVSPRLREGFLQNNRFFTPRDITDNPIASLGLPGMDLPDKPPANS
jgi:HEPN domain-containing protein